MEFPKKYLLLRHDYAKVFDCVDHNKLWKILKEVGIADHFTCLLRNLYAGQQATVRTGHGESLHPWDKAHLVMVCFLMCCWILIARILLRIFASMSISDIGL